MGAALVKAILGKSPEWTLVKIAHPDEFTSTAVNSKQVPIPGPETFDQARCLSWVKIGKAPCEQMFSALPLRADMTLRTRYVRFVPILLQTSFRGDERKSLEPLMRFTRGDVGDHILHTTKRPALGTRYRLPGVVLSA